MNIRRTAPTIKDIAEKAGVSIATVSRALNQEEGLSDATRERVLGISRQLRYYPNLHARDLVAGKPRTIGIVIPQTSEFALSNPFYTEVLKGVGARINQSGEYLVLSFLQRESYARIFHSRLASGLLVLANRMDDPGIEEARKSQIPMVLIPGDPTKTDIPSVDGDHDDGVRQALDHLIGMKHRHFALLRGPMNSKYSVERLAAFRRVLNDRGIPLREDRIVEYDFTPEGAYAGTRRLLSSGAPPTGLLLMNDFSAMGVVRAAEEMGYRVPGDVSVVGFGDTPLAAMTNPPLTTVHEPFQEMGYRAADTLLKMTQGKRINVKHKVLPVELVLRKSTAPPRRTSLTRRKKEHD